MSQNRTPRRGEIWTVDFNPPKGSEISKIRPAAILNLNNVGTLPLRIVLPITGWQKSFAGKQWMIRIQPRDTNGLQKPSALDCFQIKSVSLDRFHQKIGALSAAELEEAAATIALCVGYQ